MVMGTKLPLDLIIKPTVSLLQTCIFNIIITRVPLVATAETNPTRSHEVVGSIPGLIQQVKDPALLWLWPWPWPAAVAPV